MAHPDDHWLAYDRMVTSGQLPFLKTRSSPINTSLRLSRRYIGTGLAALAITAALTGCNPTKAMNGTDFSQTNQVDVQPGMVLRVDTPGVGVTLTAGGDSRVEVSATGNYSDKAPQVSATKTGDTATVTAGCSGSCDLQLHITVPATMQVQVKSGNSEIVADGLGGKLDLRTGNGAITTRRTTGPLSLHSGNGQVKLTDSRSPQADVSTTAGAVDATFAAAPTSVNISTKSGAVDLSVPKGAGYSIDAHSTGSTPEVDLPNDRNAAHSLTVATANGGLHIH